jgi:hypothetical protein
MENMATLLGFISGFILALIAVGAGFFLGFMVASTHQTGRTPKLIRKAQAKVDAALREPAVHAPQLTPKERRSMDDEAMQRFKGELAPGVGHEEQES